MNSKNKGGRPPRYPYEMLFDKLVEYSNENQMGEITLSSLAKYSGIPRHIWRDNKDINKDIERLKNEPLIVNDGSNDLSELPNLVEMVEKLYPNKKRLLAEMRIYMDLFEVLHENSKGGVIAQSEADNLKKENEELKNEITVLKKSVESYKNQLKQISVQSMSLKERKENNISKNVLSIADNKKKAGASVNDFKKEFKDLFS